MGLIEELTLSDPEDRAILEDYLLKGGGKLIPTRRHCPTLNYGYPSSETEGDADTGEGAGGGPTDDMLDWYIFKAGGGTGEGADGPRDDGTCQRRGGHGEGNPEGMGSIESPPFRPVYCTEGKDLEEGLKIITLPGGYVPYVLVGWLKRVAGDEWHLHNARVIRRFGAGKTLTDLAEEGPAEDTQLLSPSAKPEEVHRLNIGRSIPCNEESWKEACPKPSSYSKEE
jgi:hypothetical protein